MDWRERAKCRGQWGVEPNDPMFPTKGGNAIIVATMAKALCNGDDGYPICPVREECLLFAMHNKERFGIWGGMSERERSRLKNKPESRWLPPKRKRRRDVQSREDNLPKLQQPRSTRRESSAG